MSIRTALCSLVALAHAAGCDLALEDDPFYRGTGRISGRTTHADLPVRGAQVSWIGQRSEEPPVLTGRDGNFTLDRVPAGEREIIARAAADGLALRASLTVVAGRTTELGEIVLDTALDLIVTVRDPDLGVAGAVVRLAEVPGLESTTDEKGAAVFPAIPPLGTYTAIAQREPFVFTAGKGPEEGLWDQGITVVPDTEIDQTQVQVHHAYSRLLSYQNQLSSCDGACLAPDWWTWPGPPCPWPVGTGSNKQPGWEKWEAIAEQMKDMDRFNSGLFSLLSCPSQTYTPDCISGRCSFESTSVILSAELIAEGSSPWKCVDRLPLVADSESDLVLMDACLEIGQQLEPPSPDSRYVLSTFEVPALPPRIVFAEENQGLIRLFHSAELPTTRDTALIPQGSVCWALYLIEFTSGSAPSADGIEIHLSWINPT